MNQTPTEYVLSLPEIRESYSEIFEFPLIILPVDINFIYLR